MKTLRFGRNRERGSLLIVAMIMCAVIGISLASYIQLGRTSLVISNRALYNNGAMNLAENGLEEAMYSINKRIADPTYNWAGWTTGDGSAWRQFPTAGTYNFDQGATGVVRVLIRDYLSTDPSIVARSTVTLAGGATQTIEKWVRVQLKKTSKFANGLVAKESIRFDGDRASVDSWISDKDRNNATPATPYSTSPEVRRDKGTVASVSVSVRAPLVQNVEIWGLAATGGTPPVVGVSGLVGPIGTPAGTVNHNHISADFTTNFEPVAAPAITGYSIGAIVDNLSLPRVGDLPAADGKYYYTSSQVQFEDKRLRIEGTAVNVVLRLTASMNSINIGGTTGELKVDPGCTLAIYAPGDIAIAGRGITNGANTTADANHPAALQIWGTKTEGVQNVAIAGTGALSSVLYAPQGSVTVTGYTDVCGSVIANKITLVGNVAFHYDESLGDTGGTNPFRVSKWQELTTASNREPYAAALNF